MPEEVKKPGSGFGLRPDGSKKGPGFMGTLKRPDGGISTELSTGVGIDGKEILIPLLVPTLSKSEIDYLLKGGEPTEQIVSKAVEHAMVRMKHGVSPFKSYEEQIEENRKKAIIQMQENRGLR